MASQAASFLRRPCAARRLPGRGQASICHLVLGDVPAAKEAITQARSIMQTLDASGLQPMAQAVEERYRNIMAR